MATRNKWWQALNIDPHKLSWNEGLLLKGKWIFKHDKILKLGPDLWRVKNHTVSRDQTEPLRAIVSVIANVMELASPIAHIFWRFKSLKQTYRLALFAELSSLFAPFAQRAPIGAFQRGV